PDEAGSCLVAELACEEPEGDAAGDEAVRVLGAAPGETEGPQGDRVGVELDRLAMIVEGGVQLDPLHHATPSGAASRPRPFSAPAYRCRRGSRPLPSPSKTLSRRRKNR